MNSAINAFVDLGSEINGSINTQIENFADAWEDGSAVKMVLGTMQGESVDIDNPAISSLVSQGLQETQTLFTAGAEAAKKPQELLQTAANI